MQQIAPVLADLHLLTVLAETCSFTQTAQRLGVSKASVSMRLAELERIAGVPLVRRTTRCVTLTEAGLHLVEDTQASFAHIEHSFAMVQDQAGAPRGLIRVTAPVALGRQFVAPTMAKFLRQYPEIRIELELTDRFVNLAQEGFDVAIRHTSSPPDTHVAWVLCASRSVLVASPDYLRIRGVPDHPSELAAHDCVLYLRDRATQNWLFESRVGNKRTERFSVSVNGSFKANNSEVLREVVLGGLGIGLLPDFSAVGNFESKRLVRVLPRWTPIEVFGERLYAIRPWTAQVPRAVRCFVDHLRQTFAAGFEG